MLESVGSSEVHPAPSKIDLICATLATGVMRFVVREDDQNKEGIATIGGNELTDVEQSGCIPA